MAGESFRYRHSWAAVMSKLLTRIPAEWQEEIHRAIALLDDNERQGEDFISSEVGGGDPEGWTPTMRFGGTAITDIGDGLLSGRFRRQGDWVDADIELLVGSTTTYGAATGDMSFDLPPDDLPARTYMPLGEASMYDAGAGTEYSYVAKVSANTGRVLLEVPGNSPTFVTKAAPGTIGAAGDRVDLTLRYYSPRS